MGDDGDRISVEGQSFWRTRSEQGASELNHASIIEIGAKETSWKISPPGAKEGGEVIKSESPLVRWWMATAVETMKKIRHRADVRPVPKPIAKSDASAPKRFIPCPQCQGEAWQGCDTCEGAGYIPAPRRR